MTISIIVAVNHDNAIGRGNDMLYHLPADLKHFKNTTSGHTVIMGRKTFESLPKGALPNRRNLVLTRREGASFPGTDVYPDLRSALDSCREEEEVFIMGGGQIYRQAMDIADRLYITLVDDDKAQAEVYFPEISEEDWEEVSREDHEADERHKHAYSFINYRRKKR